MVKEKIARMTMDIYAAESMVYMTAALVDRGDTDYSIESAIAKVFASEMVWYAVDENLQIWGGAGFMKEYPYEQWFRDARINRIFEGTNEILRAFIALSGMQGPGEELAGLAQAIRFPLQGLGPVSDFAIRKLKRSVLGVEVNQAHPSLKKMAGSLEEFTVQFANQLEVLLRRHGKKVHLMQFAQKRIADVATDLYAMFCIISRLSHRLEKVKSREECELELSIGEAFFLNASRRIRANFRSIDHNADEAMKSVADQMYELGEYPFDILKF